MRIKSLLRGLRSRSFSGALLLFKGFAVLALIFSAISVPSASATDGVCPDGSHLVGAVCASDSTSITPLSSSSVENCPTPVSGQTATLNSTTHLCAMSAISVAASLGTSYSCPGGGSLDTSSPPHCITTLVSHAAGLTQSFYCPAGTPTASGASGILDTCVVESVVSSVAATTTPVWSCNYGGYQATRAGTVYCITSAEVDSAPTVVDVPSCLSNATLGANGLCNAWQVTNYASTSQNIYSCPTGQKLNGAWCQVSLSYSAPASVVGSQYVCPSGGVPDGVNTPPLCQTTKLISSVAPTITSTTTCATGSLTGAICVVTAESKYSALGSVGYAPCGAPAQNIGVNCIVYRSVTSAASVSNGYGCDSGTPSGSGSSMICITTAYSNVLASANSLSDNSGFTGGSYSQNGSYFIRTFTGSGTLGGVTGSSPPVDLVVVAGGGNGGASTATNTAKGGGGAGGVLLVNALSISSNVTITVGTGDQNSSFGGYTAIAGGDGNNSAPTSGGSGGGGSSGISGAAGTSGQGYAGGNCGACSYDAGGGGGAGSVGGNAVTATADGGHGGSGLSTWAGTFAGGGGGGTDYSGNGGIGADGGGNAMGGNTSVCTAGTPNTGGGGGGGKNTQAGCAGGSGIVVIRWAGTTGTYFCPTGTPSGSGSSMICTVVPAASVSSILVYSGTCATGYSLNTATGFCDSTSVTLGIPVIPTGSFYCSQTDLGSTNVEYSVLPYDGSAYNGSSLRTCSMIPPVGFAMSVPVSTTVFLSSYLCELFKVDPKTGVQTTLDYGSDTDNTGSVSAGAGYVSCTLVFSDTSTPATADASGDGNPSTDGSGDSTGYIADVTSCFTSTDPSDISALTACLNAA